MVTTQNSSRSATLIPAWFSAAMVVGLAVLTAASLGLGLAVREGGAWFAIPLGVACGALLVAAVPAFYGRRRPLSDAADGEPVVVTMSWLSAGAALLAWVCAAAAAAAMVYLAFTGVDALTSPVFALVFVVAMFATGPDLVRLFRGRLHRFAVELDADALTYRGYRTQTRVPWTEVRRVTTQMWKPAGIVVHLRDGETVVLPTLVLPVPAQDLVDAIYSRTARR